MNTNLLPGGTAEPSNVPKDVSVPQNEVGSASKPNKLPIIPPVIERENFPEGELPNSCPQTEKTNLIARGSPSKESIVGDKKVSNYENHIKSRDEHKQYLDKALPLLEKAIKDNNEYWITRGSTSNDGYVIEDGQESMRLLTEYIEARDTVINAAKLYRADLCWLTFFFEATYGFFSLNNLFDSIDLMMTYTQ